MPAVPQRPPRLAIAFACLFVFAPSPAHALLPDLSTGGTPPGWYGPAVPRNTGDAGDGSALLPFQLLPTPELTYFNWSVHQNASAFGTWHDYLYVGGELVQSTTRSNFAAQARWWLAVNTGPIAIEGGRHSIRIETDPEWAVPEDYTFRSNNTWNGSSLWQPSALAAPRKTFPPASNPDATPVADLNAFAFTRTPGTAWVVSTGTNAPNAADPLIVYDDYVNSTTGLTQEIGRSTRGGSLTNFVVGSADGAAAALYPSVLRTAASAPHALWIAGADAAGRRSANGAGSWPSVNLPAGCAAHVFEAYLTAGYGESATLTRFLGASDLEILVYPPGLAAASRAQAQWASTPRDGDDEYDDFAFTPTETGWHLFVVSRVDGALIEEVAGYALELNAVGTVDAPSAFVAVALAAAPSPSAGPMRLSFALSHPAHVTLALYDVQGRAVRRLVDEALPAGPHARAWDGADDRGRAVPSGRYFARLTAGSRSESLGVLRIR